LVSESSATVLRRGGRDELDVPGHQVDRRAAAGDMQNNILLDIFYFCSWDDLRCLQFSSEFDA
jgi:hypothetical protein